ncbi:dioxygenase [Nocardia otitidiscaviarum]|uniref:Dioxygenase n=1 Tax=Nocardia otitidiscaviarum TaxID=1823 RepID=A0A516NQ24_9NOCA|nr:dioxygenase [Nocardia otitidiscaviarum]MCP9623686.1 dioxygenase [Nocardia otitidiscaviarum]QDP81010.1 dioxygenase [Nocardia otitidiscaviarum]
MGDRDEHDLGLAHDLRVMGRRRALRFFGAAGAAAGAAVLTGCASDAAPNGAAASTTTTGTTSAPPVAPTETAGPYPGDGTNGPNVLIESGVVRQDLTTSFGAYSGVAEGVPATIELTLVDLLRGAPGADMAVYLWQCDREGRYSLYSSGVEQQNYLRGVQVADAAGTVRFTSIFPACYEGRWPHFHFEVYDSLTTAVAGSNARLTSQIALPQEACEQVYTYDSGYRDSTANLARVSLSSDYVFGDGWDAELATVTGTPADGMAVTLTIGVGEAKAAPVLDPDAFHGQGTAPPP